MPKFRELKAAEKDLAQHQARQAESKAKKGSVEITLHNAIEWLRNMTPDQIAALMKERGIQGRQGTTYHCPLANLFKSEFGGQFVIGRKWIYRLSGRKMVREHCLDNLATFIRKFDISGYPELIAPPPRVMAKRIQKPETKERNAENRHKKPMKRYPRSPRVNHPSKDASRWIA